MGWREALNSVRPNHNTMGRNKISIDRKENCAVQIVNLSKSTKETIIEKMLLTLSQ